MEEKEKYAQLEAIVANYLPDDVAADSITETSDFTGELNINSANLVDIVLDVDDAFDIRLENDDMDGMKTVGDALKIIDAKLAEKS